MGSSTGRPCGPSGPHEPEHVDGVAAYAVCCDCGADIPDWRERLLPIVSGRLALTERQELAVQVGCPDACQKCGGWRAEIRVEARRALDA